MAGDPSSNGTAVQRVDWSALRAYIAGKEAFEAEHGHPAPLTDQEVSAIAILLRPAPRPEPDLGKTNWLGLLNRELKHFSLSSIHFSLQFPHSPHRIMFLFEAGKATSFPLSTEHQNSS
ncbi:hypothetical protein CNYM01_14051 [Colletotrichum nymphaeae SA-01]|uniref:Uncharacterized protein n=1 Tax=Colletotrichum nymphaeae SA-01 TaxID=1460502 RepID=A0A135SYG5_9PEZI|nr:hypothetical protein CNYM01_14051 [Colletotrichum nymphaeae SA-01]